jgi:hypothetical protein
LQILAVARLELNAGWRWLAGFRIIDTDVNDTTSSVH